ncbi:NAD-dependent epimerase/dehydratase family protein [Catellatospora chokoriensis]|uniref:Reductase n=1 Tax=Catellatospora chokoriensis TaxID=310353 RepID=A0A8J3K3G5_9ACTN|nr:NAD-dependent epimerase/dehydratase family protein [Catellatospora chokoriensis]GIF92198.1 reductase [Catellatospora chokoriensis]
MRLLILGGTRFLGRALATDAVGRGWQVTAFHRGVSGAPPAGVTAVHGDRTQPGDLAPLADRAWDAVIDTWDGPPQVVARSSAVLEPACGRYVHVSSRSVYRDLSTQGLTELSPLVSADVDSFGAYKAAAEHVVRATYGDRALIARPGLVLGPHEQPERLVWWLRRLARSGEVPVPGPPELGLQCIDVRDLACWLLDAAHANLGGAYNVVSRPGHTTMGALLSACAEASGSRARLRWVPPAAVLAAGVRPWSDLPIWVPQDSDVRGLHETDAERAHATGLRCRPVEQTVADTWAWLTTTAGPLAAEGLGPRLEAMM